MKRLRLLPATDMMKVIITGLLPLFLLLATGCRMELPEQGSEGERLYAAKCALCHPAFHPKTLSAREWRGVVRLMEKRVEATGVREPLSEAQQAVILGYLDKHARKLGI
jgi:hypothetical protein